MAAHSYLHNAANAITNECRELLLRHADEVLSYVNFEGCISAKTLVAALLAAGPVLSRESLMASLEAMRSLDLGGFRVTFSAQDHQGNDTVCLTELLDGHIHEVR